MNGPFQYCPFCGAAAPTFVSAKEMRCDSCGGVYFLNPGTAVGVVIEDLDGRILFLRRAREPRRGFLALPGGFVDPGERAEQALAREVLEETGLQLGRHELIGTYPNRYIFQGVTYHTTDLIFYGQLPTFEGLRCCEESDEAVFVDRRSLDFQQVAFDSVRAALRDHLTRSGTPAI